MAGSAGGNTNQAALRRRKASCVRRTLGGEAAPERGRFPSSPRAAPGGTHFTDLANQTSTHIYQQIGYRPVCDFAAYRFE